MGQRCNNLFYERKREREREREKKGCIFLLSISSFIVSYTCTTFCEWNFSFLCRQVHNRIQLPLLFAKWQGRARRSRVVKTVLRSYREIKAQRAASAVLNSWRALAHRLTCIRERSIEVERAQRSRLQSMTISKWVGNASRRRVEKLNCETASSHHAFQVRQG